MVYFRNFFFFWELLSLILQNISFKEKKEETAEESDDDIGFSLFD